MTHTHQTLEGMPDRDLLAMLTALAANERQATAQLIAALGEVDCRRLYLGEGCSSLVTYCTQVLHLSEHAAYGRIEAARAARKWPVVLELIADGSIHLTALTLLSRHFTAENHEDLLSAATHKTKREVEEIVAALRPQPAVASTVRKLPATPALRPEGETVVAASEATNGPQSQAVPPLEQPRAVGPSSRAIDIKPLAPERYKVQFTVTRETYDKLREAQDLLRHCVPSGDIAAIFERALTWLLTELRKTKHAAVARPRVDHGRAVRGRHVPAAVKRAVWDRDGGQCAFVGASGRCSERGFLEYHHVLPFADGGGPTVDNLELRCRSHNTYEAAQWCGLLEQNCP
jgi:5-methylcytosine-specific restriction endonuclease McrA